MPGRRGLYGRGPQGVKGADRLSRVADLPPGGRVGNCWSPHSCGTFAPGRTHLSCLGRSPPTTEDLLIRITFLRPLTALGLALTLAVAGTGCGDLETAPQVEVATPEITPTLRFHGSLPDLPSLVDRWGEGFPMETVMARWEASWDLPGHEGERERRELYAAVTHPLSSRLTEAWLEEELARASGTLAKVTGLVETVPNSNWDGPLQAAFAALKEAEYALEAGDPDSALGSLLLTGDALRALTPGMVARGLISAAEASERRISDSAAYDEQTLRRGERLLTGARHALAAGDEALALRRAYYALRLLTGPVDG